MTGGVYSFGPFTLDTGERRLLRDGEPVEVTARYFDALVLLVGEGGRLISKERFHEEVWHGIPVTDEALTQCVRTLRRALGDDAATPRFIETVPRHGYRFVAPIDARPEAAATMRRASGVLPDIAAAALGGGLAGIVGALGYLTLGLAGPGIGTASTLLVLLSVNLLLGVVAGAAVGAGIAALGDRGAWSIAGGALGGLVIGAVGRMVGTDLFQLFFGRAPDAATGAWEGLVLGTAAGTGVWLSSRLNARPAPWRMAPGFIAGALAGLVLIATSGRLMVGSLVAMAHQFPDGRLRFDALSPGLVAAATIAEAALFAGGVCAAIVLGRRMRG
ncbi:winged helix-turn-helix domain-containing protein [Tsuneonella sp. HG222]